MASSIDRVSSARTRAELGWEPILDLGNIIGLSAEAGGAISIEPGGQFELSGAALPDVHATAAELATHLAATKRAAGEGLL